jgi:hypothetical protein
MSGFTVGLYCSFDKSVIGLYVRAMPCPFVLLSARIVGAAQMACQALFSQ